MKQNQYICLKQEIQMRNSLHNNSFLIILAVVCGLFVQCNTSSKESRTTNLYTDNDNALNDSISSISVYADPAKSVSKSSEKLSSTSYKTLYGDTSMSQTMESVELVYVIMSDTSSDYDQLESLIQQYSDTLDYKIDLLGRVYDPSQQKIIYIDGVEDEYLNNTYIMRRFGPEELSIEHYESYFNRDATPTLAIVFGIESEKEMAHKALVKIRSSGIDAFMVKTSIYMGCLH